MPEICEVCLTSQYLQKMIGDHITKITILHGRYTKTKIKGIELLRFPLSVTNIETKGKFMWITMKTPKKHTIYLMNTFGLTGEWSFEKLKTNNVKFSLESDKSNRDDYNLYFGDVRNFGTIQFTDDIKILENKLKKLAPDILQTPMHTNEFIEIVESSKSQKKNLATILMSQDKSSGLISGLGNYLVPEILYRASLSPHRTLSSLSKDEIKKLFSTIKYVLKLCYITNETKYIEHLSEFLKKHKKYIKMGKYPNYLSDINIGKDKFQFLVYRKKFDDLNNKIIGEEIIKGRTTYWCPSVQK